MLMNAVLTAVATGLTGAMTSALSTAVMNAGIRAVAGADELAECEAPRALAERVPA